MSQQIEKYKQSKILQRLLEALALDFNKLRDKVNAVFEQGRREGLDDMEIGELVRQQMKEHYSQSTIQRVLPNTAKQQQDHSKQKAVKRTTFEREPINIPADKVSITSTEEEEHNFKTKGMGVAITDDEVEDSSSYSPQVQEILDDTKEKLELIDESHKFEIENIELKKENAFLKEGIAHFKDENSSLRKKLEEYQRIPSNDALVNQIDLLKKELKEERSISLEASNVIEKLHQTIATLEGQLKK